MRLFPPIRDRRGKWSPLQLGLLSLLCDVLMIPTILAISRGLGDLRTVARRERDGYWDPEHPQARTGAVWGILLGAARPLLVVGFFLVAFLGVALGASEPTVHTARYRDSELDEILARVTSSDLDTRQTALRHVGALAPSLTEEEAEVVVDRVEHLSAGHLSPAEQREVGGALAAASLRTLHLSIEPERRLERLGDASAKLDLRGRAAVVSAAARRGTPRALDVVVAVMTRPDPPPLPVEALGPHGPSGYRFLPPLLRLDIDSPVRRDALGLAARLCGHGMHRGMLSPVRGQILVEWARARSRLDMAPRPSSFAERLSPDHLSRVRYAQDAAYALGCATDERSVELLVRSSERLEVPEVELAAAIVRSFHGAPLSRAEIRRFAADPFTRRPLYDHLARSFQQIRMPARHRSSAALAEADLVQWLAEQELAPASIEHELLQTRTVGFGVLVDVHVLRTAAGERFAVGPYLHDDQGGWQRGRVVPAGPELDESWGAVSAALLVDRVFAREDMP